MSKKVYGNTLSKLNLGARFHELQHCLRTFWRSRKIRKI